jgi:hypothetical protein
VTPTELWLPIGAAAFYLYDACLMLWQNELLFVRAGKHWQASGGSEFRLGGRRLLLPNPLQPQRPQFLVRWSATDVRGAVEDAGLDAYNAALRPIGIVNFLQVLLLVALPLVAWTLGAGILLLAVFLLFYVCSIVALTLIWRRRAVLQVTGRRFGLLALDALACAPFAINLTRKLAMQRGLAGDPLLFARQHLDPAARTALAELVASRLREEHVDDEAALTEQSAALRARLES